MCKTFTKYDHSKSPQKYRIKVCHFFRLHLCFHYVSFPSILCVDNRDGGYKHASSTQQNSGESSQMNKNLRYFVVFLQI